MSPSTLRESFDPRKQLEVVWRPMCGGKSALFPNTIDGFSVDAEFEFRNRHSVLLLLMVSVKDGVLVQEGLIGWLETDKRTREVRTHKQRVLVVELKRLVQRHGGQSDEVAA